jgi:hypothetical protein
MEWGFLFSLMQTEEIAELVDELYIELHFNFPALYWYHYHSNWEGWLILFINVYDVFNCLIPLFFCIHILFNYSARRLSISAKCRLYCPLLALDP